MAIVIRDQHLEQQIDKIRESRGDSTMAKTASDLLREYLTAMNVDGAYRPAPASRTQELAVSGNDSQKT